MADKINYNKAGFPIKYADNGDGTFSEVVSTAGGGSGGATLAEQQLQTARLAAIETAVENVGIHRYPSQAFFNALTTTANWNAGDTIRSITTQDTSTNTEIAETWKNMRTGLALATPPVFDTDIEFNSGEALTYNQFKIITGDAVVNPANYTINYYLKLLNTATGVISDSQATDATSSWSEISLLKGLWTKVNNLLSSQTFTYVTAQNPSITASSTQSSAVNASTNKIIVTAIGNDAYILLGSNPTATVGGVCVALADGVPSMPLTVTPGVTKVAVIASSAAGTLNIVEYA
jgi:hypothetical protein